MIRYVVVLATLLLPLACASSGTTTDGATGSTDARQDRYRVDYSAGCDVPQREGLVGRDQPDWCRFSVWYVDRDGTTRWTSVQRSWQYSFLTNAGTLASVTIKRTGGNKAGRLGVAIRVEGERVAYDWLESAGADSITVSAEVVP